jgi:hypothetical protein
MSNLTKRLHDLKDQHALTGARIGVLTGVVPRTVRGWLAPDDNPRHVDIPPSAWRLLRILLKEATPEEIIREAEEAVVKKEKAEQSPAPYGAGISPRRTIMIRDTREEVKAFDSIREDVNARMYKKIYREAKDFIDFGKGTEHFLSIKTFVAAIHDCFTAMSGLAVGMDKERFMAGDIPFNKETKTKIWALCNDFYEEFIPDSYISREEAKRRIYARDEVKKLIEDIIIQEQNLYYTAHPLTVDKNTLTEDDYRVRIQSDKEKLEAVDYPEIGKEKMERRIRKERKAGQEALVL